ncbi:hypothetical protein ACIRYZ_14175 [Kitasatospora sp. NPDC101155]|uniref:hypothetical protein n=1 Tax=Kitasatospora sp. NPDC101155 TaxID=3364097 RepID=UPI0038174645
MLVLADDVQWLDDATVSILAFMARRVGTEPVVMVGAARDGYRSRLNPDEMTTVLLEPLSDDEATVLLADRVPHLRPTAHRRLLAAAAGNPLALTELSSAVGAADPQLAEIPLTERLERAFTDRLRMLPEATRSLLQVAALDDASSLPEIYCATGVFTGAAVGAADLEPAVRARLVEVVGTELRFGHPLMRSAIEQAMAADVRHAAHAALAAVLEGQPDRQVRHRAATGTPDESVAVALQDAARRAARRGGIAAAVTALEQAAALSEDVGRRAERLLLAADFAAEPGRPETVTRLLDRALTGRLSRQQHARAVWLRGACDEGLHSHSSGALSLTALAQEMAAEEPVLALRILWSAAQLCFWSDPGPEVRREVLAAVERMVTDELDPWRLAICAYAAPIERGAYVLNRARAAE